MSTNLLLGLSPAGARIYHEDIVTEDKIENICNSRVNPPKAWIYQIHEEWLKENYGNLKNRANFFE